MATIRDVARIAGVSPATVSRVMNGTARVGEEKRQRVMDAIAQTKFQPNDLARALFKNSSKIIGLIVPNIENPFFSELARAIEEEAFLRGFRLLLCNSNNNSEKERINIGMLEQMKADGIILITNSDKTGMLAADIDTPVVVLDRHILGKNSISFVEADHYKGGRLAMQHLLACDCQNIVCIRGPQEFSSGLLRFQGYQSVCQEHNLPERYIDCDYTFSAGKAAAEELLEKYPDADGIMACNEIVALSIYKKLHSTGRRVPEDIQLIGFDDISICDLVTPELTTIHQPIDELGRSAVEIISRYSEGLAFEKNNIKDVTLVERQTTRKPN